MLFKKHFKTRFPGLFNSFDRFSHFYLRKTFGCVNCYFLRFFNLNEKKYYFRETCYNIKRFATGFGRAQSLLSFSLQIDE